jgi:hypothetical protein
MGNPLHGLKIHENKNPSNELYVFLCFHKVSLFDMIAVSAIKHTYIHTHTYTYIIDKSIFFLYLYQNSHSSCPEAGYPHSHTS